MAARDKLVDVETQTTETEQDPDATALSKKRSASVMEAVDQQVAEASLGLDLNTTLPFHARRRAAATPVARTRFGLLRSPMAASRTRPLATAILNTSNVAVNRDQTAMRKSNSACPNLFDRFSTSSILERLETPMRSSASSHAMQMAQPRSKSTGTFPERPMARPRTSAKNDTGEDKPHYLKRPRITYYGAGCRMNEPPIRRAKKFDGTFGKKYDQALLLAYATRPTVGPSDAGQEKPSSSKGKEPVAATGEEDSDNIPPSASIAAQTLLGAISRAAEEEVPVPLPVTPYKVVDAPPKLPSAVRQHHEQTAKRAAESAAVDESPKKQQQ
ncbi:hypothetical protein SYNPS1DRAFT_31560 [Syncephalis pseudoplumigaleata]|uniref:Uncharacterized protein n=1 Tax=Syncephalis pseudoplumigaleata TaxID=1712513 RepID=A0A4P9YUB4_9FUNG|nr:hypothetical protein SYNPS1DRAFT_31560 [Syncephalis pseudoplumigaleata]|eukprot:RKP22791.1 hypothetical protein SYNPS1DRAFT_31560 [Syncephalis pseudoplumigaleata]